MIDQEGIKSLEKGADNIRLTGSEGASSPAQEIIKAGIPKDMTMDQAFEVFMQSEGRPPRDIPELLEFFKSRTLSEGPPLPNDPTEPVNPFGPKPIGPPLPDRQMAAFGGIMGLDQRRQYGLGSSFKKAFNKVTRPFVKVAQKLMPKELAGISQIAAPFLGPVYGPLLMAAGQAKQKGRISPTALAMSMLPYTKFAGGEGIGQFKPTGYGSMGEGQSLRNIFLRGESGGGAGSKPIFGKYGTKADEFLFGTPEEVNFMEREGPTRKLVSDPSPDVEGYVMGEGLGGQNIKTEATSGIIGSGGEAFQFGKEGGPGILDTKAGQLAFGRADDPKKLSMLKLGSWATGIVSGIQAGKYKSAMEAADAAEAQAQAANEAATEAELEAARAWAEATFNSMNIENPNLADGGRINKNMGGEFNMPPAGLSSLQTQASDVTPPGMELDLRGGGFIPIGKAEKADDVPARVSKNEFVFTADAVKAAGGGSVNEGAKRMYDTMKRLESQVV